MAGTLPGEGLSKLKIAERTSNDDDEEVEQVEEDERITKLYSVADKATPEAFVVRNGPATAAATL